MIDDTAEDQTPAGWEGILEDGEEILWQGKPVPGLDTSEWLKLGNIMPLFVAGFGVFWTITAVTMMSDMRSAPGAFRLFFPLFGVLFVGMALNRAFGPLMKKARTRRGTFYTLSNRAAYIATEIAGDRTLRRYPIAEMGTIMLNAAEPGGVAFTSEQRRVRAGKSGGMRTIATQIGFDRISDPRHVYALLRDAKVAAADQG